jgi:DNA-binding winged helix-turn-helix (wHTH) protein/tetratricopeptide (TPR) repeat protein
MPAPDTVYEFGPFRLDVHERRLSRGNTPLPLRAKVFDTLCVLVEHAGKLVATEELMNAVWADTAVEIGNLAHNIAVIRKALGERDGGPKYIETLSGKGYRFIAQVIAHRDQCPAPRANSIRAELVGRERELDLIHELLNEVATGRRQTLCINGEAGIGKTLLLNTLVELASARGFRCGRGQCLEGLGEGEPYMPVLDALSQLSSGPDAERAASVLRRVAPTWVAHLPWLSDGETDHSKQTLGATKERMLREIAEALETLSAGRPVLLAIEDLHWSDASTTQFLNMMALRTMPARILVAGTYRPHDGENRGASIHSMTHELKLRGVCREIPLRPLDGQAVRRLVELRLPGATLTDEAVAITRQRTEGIPLFVEAVVDHWKSEGLVTNAGGGWKLTQAASDLGRGVPESLRSTIVLKLDSLNEECRNLIAAASVSGVDFSAAAIAAAVEGSAGEVEQRFDALAKQGSLILQAAPIEWADGTIAQGYRFVHSLYQEVVYERIPAGHRARLHHNTGDGLERSYGPSAPGKAAELAHHFERGGDPARALPYLLAAARQAFRRSAHREGINLARRGLNLLAKLPEDRDTLSLALDFEALLAPALVSVEGFASADAERAYHRAVDLGSRLGRTDLLLTLMFGQAAMFELRGDFERSDRVLEQRLGLSGCDAHSGVVVTSDTLMACSLFHQGRFAGALEHADRGSSAYDPSEHLALIAPYGETPGPACHEWGALATWFLGYPDRALRRIGNAIEIAREPDHAFSFASALVRAGLVHQLRREPEDTRRMASEASRIAETQGYPWVAATAMALNGWVNALQADFSELRLGLDMLAAMGAHLDRPFFLCLLAETLAAHGDMTAARNAITEAFGYLGRARSHFYEAELHRLKASIESSANHLDEAEASVREALRIVREQQARSLELRAAMDLCAIRRRRGAAREAVDELAQVYAWFSEGFETQDLRNARAMLEAIGPAPARSLSAKVSQKFQDG